MPSEWYQVDPVGFNRAFVVGYSGDQNVEIELSKEQLESYNTYKAHAMENEQYFLRELISV